MKRKKRTWNICITHQLNQSKMEKITKRICYYCKLEKDVSEMQQIVVWFCNKCADKFKTSDKKKK